MCATETQGTTATPYLLAREEGVNDIWWPYVPGPQVGRHTNKVLSEQTEGRLFQALISYPRGAAPPLHIHHDADETFFVLDGEVTIFVGAERYECTAGDFVLGPKGVAHTFLVRSDWAEMLATFARRDRRLLRRGRACGDRSGGRPGAIVAGPGRVRPPDGEVRV